MKLNKTLFPILVLVLLIALGLVLFLNNSNSNEDEVRIYFPNDHSEYLIPRYVDLELNQEMLFQQNRVELICFECIQLTSTEYKYLYEYPFANSIDTSLLTPVSNSVLSNTSLYSGIESTTPESIDTLGLVYSLHDLSDRDKEVLIEFVRTNPDTIQLSLPNIPSAETMTFQTSPGNHRQISVAYRINNFFGLENALRVDSYVFSDIALEPIQVVTSLFTLSSDNMDQEQEISSILLEENYLARLMPFQDLPALSVWQDMKQEQKDEYLNWYNEYYWN